MQADYSRRKFIRHISVNLGAAFIGIEAAAMFDPVEQSKAVPQTSGTNIPRKLGIALVGLGKYAGGQLAPALKETQACYLAGIVTGSPDKAKSWKAQYNIPDKNIYNYNTFDTIKDNPDIDIVYVVLPNAMHSEYVIRAAKAGKHVICEKPMAITVEECDQMIAACKEAGKMLSIGYRLHFEPYNMHMKQLGQNKVYGAIKKIKADNGMGDAEGWRLDKKLAGGGPLMDVGIYCVQGARYTSGREPIAVTAKEGPKTNPTKFSSVEESLTWQMEFPDGMIAECSTSYSKEMNLLRADAEAG
jgi:predicted dehydrogenase